MKIIHFCIGLSILSKNFVSNTTGPIQISLFSSKTELSEKPNSRNFELAHELINSALSKATGTPTQVDPSHIAHIGDDFEADYIGAKRYGFQAFLLDRHGKPERKQKEIAEQAGETQADVLNQPQLYASFDHIIRDLGLERRQFANVASAGSR